MKKIYITLIGLLSLANMSFSQTSAIKVSDVSAKYFTYTDPVTKVQDTNKVIIRMVCNIENIEQAKKLHLLLGTAAGLGDGLTTVADVLQLNGGYVIKHAGNTFPVHAYRTQLQLVINKTQLANCQYMSIYVEDGNGNNTQTLNTTVK